MINSTESAIITIVTGSNGTDTCNNESIYPTALYFDHIIKRLIITNYGVNNIVRWIIGVTHWVLIVDDINRMSRSSTSTNQQVLFLLLWEIYLLLIEIIIEYDFFFVNNRRVEYLLVLQLLLIIILFYIVKLIIILLK